MNSNAYAVNENYEKEITEWLQGKRSGDSVGVLGWVDGHKKVSLHDAVMRYDLSNPLKQVQNHAVLTP